MFTPLGNLIELINAGRTLVNSGGKANINSSRQIDVKSPPLHFVRVTARRPMPQAWAVRGGQAPPRRAGVDRGPVGSQGLAGF